MDNEFSLYKMFVCVPRSYVLQILFIKDFDLGTSEIFICVFVFTLVFKSWRQPSFRRCMAFMRFFGLINDTEITTTKNIKKSNKIAQIHFCQSFFVIHIIFLPSFFSQHLFYLFKYLIMYHTTVWVLNRMNNTPFNEWFDILHEGRREISARCYKRVHPTLVTPYCSTIKVTPKIYLYMLPHWMWRMSCKIETQKNLGKLFFTSLYSVTILEGYGYCDNFSD